MANTNPKMFVNFTGSKKTFVEKGYPTTYANSIVFISGDDKGATVEDRSSCIFAKGKYFANASEAKKYLATLPYFKGIKIGNTTYNAANGGGDLALAANDPATLTINANSDGVVIGLTDAAKNAISGAAQSATGDGKYISAAQKGTAITVSANVETNLATSASADKLPTAKAAKGYADDAKKAVVGIPGDKKDANTVYGAKAYTDDAISTLTSKTITPISNRVKDIEDSYATKTYADGAVNTFKTSLSETLSVTDTNNFVAVGLKQTDGKINSLTVSTENIAKSSEVGVVGELATTKKTVVEAINEVLAAVGTGGTNAVVTMEKATDGLSYTLKQGGSEIGVINIPKDMVVNGGSYADGNLTLNIANGKPVVIPVADLIDLYTGGSTIEIAVDVDSENVISATLVDGGVTTAKIANGAITTAKIADDNVTTAKILDANVTTAKIADRAVTTAKIALGSVGEDQLSDEVTTILGRVGSKAVSAQISDAVNALDSNATSTDGTNVAVKVTQTDGKITAVNITKDDTLKEVEGSTYVSASSKSSAKQTISVTVKPVLGDGVATAAGQGLADAYAVNQALGETYTDAVEDAGLYTKEQIAAALTWEELS